MGGGLSVPWAHDATCVLTARNAHLCREEEQSMMRMSGHGSQ
jgi:hypothetical protein